MHYLEWLLIIYLFFLFPAYELATHQKAKRLISADPDLRKSAYISTVIFLWMPTLVLLGLYFSQRLSIGEIGLTILWDWRNQLGAGLLIILCGYFLYATQQLKHDASARAKVRQGYADHLWFMPGNREQWLWFTLPVSITAGICEEILFRGYLINLLSTQMPTLGAAILSSALFGLLHIYQGAHNALRIAMVGMGFAAVYLLTDSLLLPILLHIAMDMYAGTSTYRLAQHPEDEEDAELADTHPSLG